MTGETGATAARTPTTGDAAAILESSGPLRLHGYWRSTTAYRVRIALNLKGLNYTQATHDLRIGEQREAAYRHLAPQGLVPAVEAGPFALTQSLAILEWLEERVPAPPLLPAGAADRAIVRSMAALIACDIHPINNLRILQALRVTFGATQAQLDTWTGRWIQEGFAALEQFVGRHGGHFAFGDTPTLADCCLVPQIYAAERYNVDLSPFPRLLAAAAQASALPAFAAAHPSNQPDADQAAAPAASA